jgi:hypothetical protein
MKKSLHWQSEVLYISRTKFKMRSQYPGVIDIHHADKIEWAFPDVAAILVRSNAVRQADYLHHQQIGE